QTAIPRADGAFRERESLLNQLALDTGSDHARDTSCLRADGRCKERNQRRRTEDSVGSVIVFARVGLCFHIFLPWSSRDSCVSPTSAAPAGAPYSRCRPRAAG